MRPFSRAIELGVLLSLHLTTAFAAARVDDTRYWLVVVNGRTSNALVEFRPVNSRIFARRQELQNVGVAAGAGAPDDLVALDSLPGARYDVRETDQSIHFDATADALATQNYTGREAALFAPTPIDPGFVVNYNALATMGGQSLLRGPYDPVASTRGVRESVALDARAFSPWGELSTTGVVGSTQFRDANLLRLDSAYEYADRDRMLAARLGDTISGGFAWTRPIRLGGAQLRRDFGLRSDLVTAAVPTLGGTAAVPTLVDVFVNNVSVYSANVGQGPYRISDIPMLTGAGSATIVTRDVAGREVRQELPFFSSPRLLRAGLYDYSLEAGYPRVGYGLASDAYVRNPVGSASGRYGLSDSLTLEAHAEGGAGLLAGGVGLNTALGGYGVLSGAVSGSRDGARSGLQLYAAAEMRWGSISINAASLRASDGYEDLASVTARPVYAAANGIGLGQVGLPQYLNVRPLRALDRIGFSAPLDAIGGTGSLSFVRQKRDDGIENRLLMATYARSWRDGLGLFVSVLGDVGDRRNRGLFFGLSKRFGETTTSVALNRTDGRMQVAAEAFRPLAEEPGSYGWRASNAQGAQTWRSASAAYRSSVGRVEARVEQGSGEARGSLEMEGAVGMVGGQPFVSNRVIDSFAVVRTGAAGVAVTSENRPAGRTGWMGALVVPNLRSFERNKIAIDVDSLPDDMTPAQTEMQIVPAGRGGVLVDLAKGGASAGLVVRLVGADGKPLPVGASGRSATGEDFVVGYDGEAYLADGGGAAALDVTLPAGGACRAALATDARRGPKSEPTPCL